MNIKLELTEDCPQCDGCGYSYPKFNSTERVDCSRCRGRGQVPSELGFEILAFVRDYADEVEP